MEVRLVGELDSWGWKAGAASSFARSDEAQDKHDDGDHEQDMDESPDSVRGDQTEEPEHDENNGDSVKHNGLIG